MENVLQLIPLSSLVKVFPDTRPDGWYRGGSVLRNDRLSFQVAYCGSRDLPAQEYSLSVSSPLKPYLSARQVGVLPAEFLAYSRRDENYLRTTPGLYPDPLYPLLRGGQNQPVVEVLPGRWHSLWFTLEIPDSAALSAGTYSVTIELLPSEPDAKASSASVTLEFQLLDAALTPDCFSLLYTNWFHADCLASVYKVPVFSPRHWELMEAFIRTAAKNGMNMILTPAFTPPLDTPVGGERLTVQLVEVYKAGEHYTFGFDKLGRWIDLCRRAGITHFEHSHLFTQWGAKAAPKIMGWENGEYKRLFGWDTPADGEAYASFLHQYLPAVISFFREKGVDRQVWYHISDEPTLDNLDGYARAWAVVREELKGYEIFEALSSLEVYEKGYVTTPIPSTDHILPFLGRTDRLWTYYCGLQSVDLSNRFFSIPSARNRILGVQLYKYDIKGFLQWAFNFYYTVLSKKLANPFQTADAYGQIPAGSAYMVYPGEDGPIESIRLAVFFEAIQDCAALRLLESRIGREETLQLIDDGIEPITFTRYPHDDNYLLGLRQRVNRRLAESLRAPT